VTDDDGLGKREREEVLEGLTSDPKRLPPHLFYDARGSRLFEEITEQPEYYLTDAESAIFEAHADEIVAGLPDGTSLVELGAGSARKTRHLLEALLARGDGLVFHPIDVSAAALEEARQALEPDYEDLQVDPVVGRYREGLAEVGVDGAPAKLVVFMGSSIGNMEPDDARDFLASVRETLAPEDRLLLGTDLVKDRETLEAAYNDAAGVTAAFNRNVLERLNRELGAGFPLDDFAHRAFWNEDASRVEMHLEAEEVCTVDLGDLDREVRFEAGETIHTENSYKFTLEDVDDMVESADLAREATWTDEGERFADHVLAPD
jgi:dimethylhistidine N-methyltransferase